MKYWKLVMLTLLVFTVLSGDAFSFCGFYVAKVDTKLFNKASQVVLVRNENKTVLTMANDFQGDPKEFAVVVPVPTFIQKEQIHIGDKAVIEHLAAYSAPRLVEYFDEDPCRVMKRFEMSRSAGIGAMKSNREDESARSLGVKIEARYTVGEYDILILSAEQSKGLEIWLRENGYRIPRGASSVLNSYLRQGMRFFIARVNLAEQAKLGYSVLRPIQVAYESPKFMLPIRLGMANADGPQELFVYALTRKGRIETTNYRTVKLPSNVDVPLFLKNENEFSSFYKAMFTRQVDKENRSAVFLEYAWDMNWCDPCAADPLSSEELRQLGVFWSPGGSDSTRGQRFAPASGGQEVFLTRLHVRYDAENFPEDLVFQETGDHSNFQGRYVLHHPWQGGSSCAAAEDYFTALAHRRDGEAQNLAQLTSWDVNEIRKKMQIGPAAVTSPVNESWWEKIWKK